MSRHRGPLSLLPDGELRLGSCFEVDFDGGPTAATFTVGDAVSPAEVDAFRLDADERDALRVVGEQGRLTWCIDNPAIHRHDIGHWMAVAAALARRHGRSRAFEDDRSTGIADAAEFIGTLDHLFDDLTADLWRPVNRVAALVQGRIHVGSLEGLRKGL